MADTIRMGIIGCGALGLVHAQRFAAIPTVEVVALAEPSSENMRKVSAAIPRPPAVQVTDYREILDIGLDAVCIASPDMLHVPQVLDALAANLHVLCEKPLTPYPQELAAVIESAKEVNRVVSMTYPRRYDAGLREMRRRILSGAWGKVTAITAYNAEDWVTPNIGTWRHDPKLCPGGFFYDASGHQLDTIFWATGLRGVSVRCMTDNFGTEVPINAVGSAMLTDGVPMAFGFVGNAHKWREQVNIHCEGMDFVMENMRAFWTKDGGYSPIATELPDETADEAFIRLIRGQGENWAPPDDVWPIVSFTAAGLESASSGREVAVASPEVHPGASLSLHCGERESEGISR